MNELLALSPIDVLTKLGPTGLALLGAFYLLRWFDDRVFKRVSVREQRVDGSTDKLISGTLGWAEDMQNWARGVQGQLDDCMHHHAACNEKVTFLVSEGAVKDARIAALETQLNMPGVARQMAQQIIATDKLAERERGE